MNIRQEDVANGGTKQSAAATDTKTTDRLAEKAHETVDRVAERSASAEREVRDQARKASKQIHRSEEKARELASESARQVENYIEKNPLISAGIAFVAGLALSALLRR